METPAQNPTPVMPPSPVQETNNPAQGSNNSSRNTLLLLGSILIFVAIVGVTLYLVVQNQKDQTEVITEDNLENEQNLVATIPTLTQEQQKETYGDVVCRRFTSIEEAIQVPEIACVLDLSGQDLSVLPEYITRLTKLNELNLSDNKFTEFPTILYEIKSLFSINLENNQLSTFPDDLKSKIPSLQSIRLEGNKLSKEVVEKYQNLNIPISPVQSPIPPTSPVKPIQ